MKTEQLLTGPLDEDDFDELDQWLREDWLASPAADHLSDRLN